MAAAYAALVSLFNNLELIQTHPRHRFSFDNKQIQSLLQIVCFLIDFMEARDYHGGSKKAAEVIERQIATAAHAAEDVIESHVVDQIHAGSTLDGKKRYRFLLDVQKVIEDMEFVRRKAIKVQKVQSEFKAGQPTYSAATSSTPPSSVKDKMVGFDDVLLQLLDLLTGYPSSLQVIPIVGTGGIGVFPEDDIINVSFLTHLWIGEGFLKPRDGQTLEEVAEGFLNDLIGRNLILVDDWSLKRKSETCAIHDVLRELCRKIAEKEKFFCVFNSSQSIDMERRVVMNERNAKEMRHALVRSQITWKGCRVLFGSKLLRVVSASAGSHELENIFGRVNLRYLRGRFQLNSSISLLWNLQTLIVRGSDTVTIAPYEIWKMTQLRHLKCYYVFLLDPLPSDDANDMVLRNLQTLERVVNLRLREEVCKRIPNIKELELTYSDSLMECDEPGSYCPHKLGHLHKLEFLDCTIARDGPEWHEFAQALTFPSSLKKLRLWNVHLNWEEITMKIGSLPFLEVLQLEYVEGGAEWNPVEGGFPRLRSLRIHDCDGLTYWNAERSHFSVLERLSLKRVLLDEFPCGIGEIPTLQTIDLENCSVCLGISALRTVVEQEDNGNDTLQLYVDFWDNKKLESFYKIVQEEGLTTNNLQLSNR